MKHTILALLALALHSIPAEANPVGYETFQVQDGANPPLDVSVWYPTDQPPSHPTSVGLFQQNVVPGGNLAGSHLPLILISHGNGGTRLSHLDTAFALAEAGFVAAALTHTGDTYNDQSRATDLEGRVRGLNAVADAMLTWHNGAIDKTRVGAFGFSIGGFTVLAAAGGHPDLSRIGPHCAAHPTYFDCTLIASHGTTQPPNAPHFAQIPTLRALVVAAPGLGFTFGNHGLQNLTIPTQLWRAEDDQILPHPDYAEAVREALPIPPDMHIVPHAGHFDFLAPCSPDLAAAAPPICTSEPGFDRTAFHNTFNAALIAFFKTTLTAN